MNNSWCPIPWNSVSIKNDGDYRVCVYASSDLESRGLLRDDHGSVLNASVVRPNDARNSATLKKLRLQMLAGERSKVCQRCNSEDDLKIKSHREWAARQYTDLIDLRKCADLTSEDGSIDVQDFDVNQIDLRFGNACNLKCRSCGPTESSQWYEDWKLIGRELKDHSFVWHSEESINKILEDIDGIKVIHVSGGEPLYVKQHTSFLETLISTGKSKNIVLDYNSNLTKLPPRVLSLWKKFDKINVGVSIDGVGGVNDYIRYPSDWKRVIANFDTLKNLEYVKCWFTSTIMIYNVYYLPELIEWVMQKYPSTNLFNSINFHVLRYPSYLCIQNLPIEVKYKVAYKLNSWSNSLIGGNADTIKTLIDGYIEFMLERDIDNFAAFVRVSKILDKSRGQDMRKQLPELYELINEYYDDRIQKSSD